MFFNSQSTIEQAHIASAFVFELSKVATAHVRETVVSHVRNIDESLAQRIADGLGMTALPPAATPAAVVLNLAPSPALAIIAKAKHTLQGRCVGILVADGTDMKQVRAIRAAVRKAGAQVKLVAPKLSIKGAGGKRVDADGQLAGTPSCQFDAVASVLSPEAAEMLSRDGAAVDWFRDAFGHLKAIAACGGTRKWIFKAAGLKADAGVFEPEDVSGFIEAAKTRQWKREPKVRTLA